MSNVIGFYFGKMFLLGLKNVFEFFWVFLDACNCLHIFRMIFLKNRSLCRAWNFTGETTINAHPRMITEKWPSEKRVWHLYCTRIRFYHNEQEFPKFVQKLWFNVENFYTIQRALVQKLPTYSVILNKWVRRKEN